MPKIQIHETDLTNVTTFDVTENTVYVPGYANMGPINTPTLVHSVSEFISIFGPTPYIFRSVQENIVPNASNTDYYIPGVYATVSSYEKSYIYALNILKNGVPVLFERLMKSGADTSNIIKWSAFDNILLGETPTYTDPAGVATLDDSVKYFTLTGATYNIVNYPKDADKSTYYKITSPYLLIRCKEPGLYGSYITYTIASENDYYQLSYRLEKDNNLIKSGYVNFSLDSANKYYYKTLDSDYIYIDVIGSSAPTAIKASELNTEKTLLLNNQGTFDSINDARSIDEFTINDLYDLMLGYPRGISTITEYNIFDKLSDNGEYQLKFISTGSYPTYDCERAPRRLNNLATRNNLTELLLDVAGTRSDATAIIDYKSGELISNISSHINTNGNFNQVTITQGNKTEDGRKYGVMFGPWATYSLNDNDVVRLPASYAYLTALGKSIKNNPNWYAVAGVTRGFIPDLLQLEENVTGAIAQNVQDKNICINPITNIKPYGYCIWGNRTLNKNETSGDDFKLIASSFLNVRMLTNDVKKVVYGAAKKLTFENNTDVLWLNFKAAIDPTLQRMLTGNGLTNYKITRKVSTKRATVEAVIRLYVVEAVEDFEIDIELADSYINIQ